MAKYCQDCGDTLGGRSSCSCGWTEKNQDTSSHYNVSQVVISCCAQGCPMPGTITESVSHKEAKEVNWYCLNHWRVRNEPHKFSAITDDLIKNPPQPKKDWRDEMMDKRCGPRQGTQQKLYG